MPLLSIGVASPIGGTGPIPKAWIGRFGRTVANQVLDAVESRMRAARRSGVEMTLTGQRVGGQVPPEDAGAAASLADRPKGG